MCDRCERALDRARSRGEYRSPREVRRVREERGREPCELHEAYDQGFKAGRDYERVRLDWIEAVREAYEQYQAGWMAALHWQSKQQEEASALGQEVARGIIEDESEDQ